MAHNPVLSRSHEDYLKVIYSLEDRFGVAQTGAIAEAPGGSVFFKLTAPAATAEAAAAQFEALLKSIQKS